MSKSGSQLNISIMKEALDINPQISRMADILEQLRDLNQLIKLHQPRENKFMLKQYEFRKAKLLHELREILLAYEVSVEDLAA